MILKLFSLRDIKAASFSAPFLCANVQVAKRIVVDMLAEGRALAARHPEDFELYEVASFDDANGKVVPLDAPVFVIGCISLMPPVDK